MIFLLLFQMMLLMKLLEKKGGGGGSGGGGGGGGLDGVSTENNQQTGYMLQDKILLYLKDITQFRAPDLNRSAIHRKDHK